MTQATECDRHGLSSSPSRLAGDWHVVRCAHFDGRFVVELRYGTAALFFVSFEETEAPERYLSFRLDGEMADIVFEALNVAMMCGEVPDGESLDDAIAVARSIQNE